jgi:predicted nucleic acid-binding Zn ribbon protein
MSHSRRSPRSLSHALDEACGGWAPATLLAELQTAWPEAVGAAIAAEATPAAERDGVVTVACSASVWAHELELMGPAIVERLNARLGGRRVTRIRCSASPLRDD